MMKTVPGKILRIYMGEGDKHGHTPLFEWIMDRARDEDMAGATVLRGQAGFGIRHHMHSSKILRLSQDLPIVVEIADSPDKIESFFESIADGIGEAHALIEDVSWLDGGDG